MGFLCFIRRTTLLVGLFSVLGLSSLPSLGRAEEILEAPGLTESEEPLETNTETIEVEPPPKPPQDRQLPATRAETAVDQPWLTTTPLVETAYTLDQRTFRAEAWRVPVASTLEMKPFNVGLKFGLMDSLMLGLGWYGPLGSGMPLVADLKWNIFNSGAWSWSIHPWFGFYTGTPENGSSAPSGGMLATSCVLDAYHKLHISLSWGKNQKAYSSNYSYSSSSGDYYYYSYYSSSSRTDFQTTRLSFGYEVRFDRRNGMTFSLSPQIRGEKYLYTSDDHYSSSGSGGYSNNSTNQTDSSEFGVLPGIAYHYQTPKFGFGVGVEAGPTYRHASYRYTGSYPSGYDTNGFSVLGMANIAGSMDVRF